MPNINAGASKLVWEPKIRSGAQHVFFGFVDEHVIEQVRETLLEKMVS